MVTRLNSTPTNTQENPYKLDCKLEVEIQRFTPVGSVLERRRRVSIFNNIIAYLDYLQLYANFILFNLEEV